MYFVGIDQSYTGFAAVILTNEGGRLDLFQRFPLDKEHSGAEARRLTEIYDWIGSWNNQYIPDYVDIRFAMEGYSFGSNFKREALGELGGIVKFSLWNHYGCEPLIAQPSSVKKFFTGKGKATKDDMLERCRELDVDYKKNHNLADAFAIAHYLKHDQYLCEVDGRIGVKL